MCPARELPADRLHRACDPERLGFRTTEELTPLEEMLGQPRAVAAVDFGVAIEREGYNLFALGPQGTGRRALLSRVLERRADERPAPPDWCYVHDFDEPRRPRALRLPAGTGSRLRRDMEHLVEELRGALTAAFESEQYQSRRQMIEHQLAERQSDALEEVGRHAEERGLRMVQSPAGIFFAPVREGEPLPPRELQRLSEPEQKRIEQQVEGLQEELQRAFRSVPRWQREHRDAIRTLNRETTRFAVDSPIDELRRRYRDEPAIASYLDAVEEDVVEHAGFFVEGGDGSSGGSASREARGEHPFLHRYRVNLLVDNGEATGAPVVYEDHPTHANLVGRVEHRAQFGMLVTDLTLIRSGALHRANGGYLVLDALELLRQPYAWPALKRSLRAGSLRIESLAESLGFGPSTVSLEPGPIPLDVKVVLVGEPSLYYLLASLDPDFSELFKVAADFADRAQRGPDEEIAYARLVARLIREESLRPFDRDAVARVIEHAARRVGDAEGLSLEVGRMLDLLREADYWARREGRAVVERRHVEDALAQQIYRSDRLRERLREEMLRETIEIATEGNIPGQINGLALLQLGESTFGRPIRITARTRLGTGEVVDIEREVELSGPLHSKGVLILAGFLGQRYAAETPLSLSASLVFEQSHAGIEGDSASSAELCALLSAISGVPLRQSLAVTGAVSQSGRVQAVGAINEKIEAFFDLCAARGLTGEQGVLIPAANEPHLMLRQDVVEAVRKGLFHVHAVQTVDDAVELLTDLPAGEPDAEGAFPAGSFNHRVATRLAALAERRRAFAAEAGDRGA